MRLFVADLWPSAIHAGSYAADSRRTAASGRRTATRLAGGRGVSGGTIGSTNRADLRSPSPWGHSLGACGSSIHSPSTRNRYSNQPGRIETLPHHKPDCISQKRTSSLTIGCSRDPSSLQDNRNLHDDGGNHSSKKIARQTLRAPQQANENETSTAAASGVWALWFIRSGSVNQGTHAAGFAVQTVNPVAIFARRFARDSAEGAVELGNRLEARGKCRFGDVRLDVAQHLLH